MGMFDWVGDGNKLFEADCPMCGALIQNGFQSKELDCQSNRIDWKYFSRFYNSCNTCGTWIDCYVENDLEVYRVYAVPGGDQSRRKLIREEPWSLEGKDLDAWAKVIHDEGAEGVRALLKAQLSALGREPYD